MIKFDIVLNRIGTFIQVTIHVNIDITDIDIVHKALRHIWCMVVRSIVERISRLQKSTDKVLLNSIRKKICPRIRSVCLL